MKNQSTEFTEDEEQEMMEKEKVRVTFRESNLLIGCGGQISARPSWPRPFGQPSFAMLTWVVQSSPPATIVN